jgi:hypothetical protein
LALSWLPGALLVRLLSADPLFARIPWFLSSAREFLLPEPWLLPPLFRADAELPPVFVRPRAETVDDCFMIM